MKIFKLNYVLLVALTSLILNCSEDDSTTVSDEVIASEIIGSWRLIQEKEYVNGEEVSSYNVPDGCDEEVINFTTDELTFNIDDNCDGTFDENDTFIYTISNNQIIVEGETAEVAEVTSSTLILKFYYDNDSYDESHYEKL